MEVIRKESGQVCSEGIRSVRPDVPVNYTEENGLPADVHYSAWCIIKENGIARRGGSYEA